MTLKYYVYRVKEKEIVTIQAYLKANKARVDYRTLSKSITLLYLMYYVIYFTFTCIVSWLVLKVNIIVFPFIFQTAGSQHPPLSVVRKFVHLLEQSSLDLQEEQEVTRLREEVVTKIRANQQMEKDLNLMDIKIGLLVKNRITLQVLPCGGFKSFKDFLWLLSCMDCLLHILWINETNVTLSFDVLGFMCFPMTLEP